jgi:hypothetical protein
MKTTNADDIIAYPMWCWQVDGGTWWFSDNVQETPDDVEVWMRNNSIENWTRLDNKQAVLQGTNQQNQNQKEERKDSMLFVIAVTQKPSALDEQKGESPKILAGPDTIEAVNQFEAAVLFGAKNADALKDAPNDRIHVTMRQGV